MIKKKFTQKQKTVICENIKKYFNIVECDMFIECSVLGLLSFTLFCDDTNIKPPFTEAHQFKAIDFHYIDGTFRLSLTSCPTSWVNHPLAIYIQFLLNNINILGESK